MRKPACLWPALVKCIPRITNAPLARLMDAGKQLFARLEAKAWHGDWLKIDIGVYLKDF